jgi:hypothetical protein
MRSMILLTILLFACETKEHADAELGAIKKAQGAAAKAAAHANTGMTEEIGVPECDDYIRTYEACLSEKVPVDAQLRLRATLDDNRRQWRAAGKDETSRASLAEQCKSAASLAKQSMSDYGCDF